MSVLFFGHNGPLGRAYCELVDRPRVIGVSRRHSDHAEVNIASDVNELGLFSLLRTLRETQKVKHIVWAVNGTHTGVLGHGQDAVLRYDIAVGLTVPIRLMHAIAAVFNAEERKDMSLTFVSSASGIRVGREHQTTYSAIKAAQLMLALDGKVNLAPMRCNALAPTAFPRIIPTSAVVDALHQCIIGIRNGSIVKIEHVSAPIEQPVLESICVY